MEQREGSEGMQRERERRVRGGEGMFRREPMDSLYTDLALDRERRLLLLGVL